MKKTLLAASVVLASLGADAFATEILVQNGSFQNGAPATDTFGTITSWNATAVPVALNTAVVSSYAGFAPFDSTRQALVSNGGGGVLTNSAFVNFSMTFPTELFRMPFLNFHWMYLTTDPASTALANRDQFVVTMDYYAANDPLGTTSLGSTQYVINTGTLTTAPGTIGGVQPNPFGSTTVNSSIVEPQQVSGRLIYSVLPIINTSAGYIRFTFSLSPTTASLASTGSSGFLLDYVYINPEPGTMALFGLGAMGLGGMVWRRRKARAAAAAK